MQAPQVIGFAAYSGTGKTTLLRQLIPQLTSAGLTLAVIKHSHHDFAIDQPGKDSYELHHAGSQQTLITSRYRSALISENSRRKEPELSDAIKQLDLSRTDLVLVEGFRHASGLKKIELHRPALNKPLLCHDDADIIALASDQPTACTLPLLDINQPQQITDFVLRRLQDRALCFSI